jgi:ribosomal-protein-alanine N-acetyltransferase
MRIEKLQVKDIPDVLDASHECRLCVWSAEAYRSELARGDSIMFRAENGNGEFAGFAVGRLFELEDNHVTAELTNIGVRQLYRRQGFGKLLLKSFLDRCRIARVRSVILEVRSSNATAIRFYERFGFVHIGRRKNFYTDPQEDALTMKLIF